MRTVDMNKGPSIPPRRTAVIRVSGEIDAASAEQLWDAIEHAFEADPGRRVVVDLTAVRGFDADSMYELANSARTAVRRHDDLRLVVDSASALGQHLRGDRSIHDWPLYPSVAEAHR